MADAYPKTGERVAIRHRSEGHRKLGVIESAHPTEIRTIAAVYMVTAETGVRIRDHVGEMWQVVRNAEEKAADWMTVPMAGTLQK